MTDLLGFGGRIGRLQFFFSTLTLVAFATAGMLGAVFITAPRASSGDRPDGIPLDTLILGLLVGIGFLWANFALQARRLRDIGWRPLPILLGWAAVLIFDAAVALAFPTTALSHGGGTSLGGLVNLALSLVLLFWPGNGESDFVYIPQGSTYRHPEPPAPTPPPPAPPLRPSFGRRVA